MKTVLPTGVKTLALFEKRFEGDDALFELARRRFLKAGMGAEMHAGTPEQLQSLLKFRPGQEAPLVVHLPRDFNLIDGSSPGRILELATRFAGQIHGLVIHDHPTIATRRAEYVAAAWKLDDQFEKIEGCPMLFVEYAAGVEPGEFAGFFAEIPDLEHLSACIDIGHVGIRAAQADYARKHGGDDIFLLKAQGPRLPQVIAEVQASVAAGVAEVLELIQALSTLRKPFHFHLHDGHPLSTFSPFGVSDHLSFFSEIPLNFEHEGRRTVPAMFGPGGLAKVVSRVLGFMIPERVSFTLEIHPTGERLPPGAESSLFDHWTDKTNAERMNHWIELLSRNRALLRQTIDSALALKNPQPLIPAPPVEMESGACDI